MTDIIEKGFFLGLGALALTREKAEQVVNELIEKGKLSREDSMKVIDELMSRAEDEKKAVEERVDKALDSAVERLGLATTKDIDQLKKQLKKIEKLLSDKTK